MTAEQNKPEQAQRLELIGMAASGVAHDLNNQLTVILNHLDFAISRLAPADPAREHLADVHLAAMRCTEMTSTLLGFGSHGASRRVATDISPLLAETVRLMRRVIPSAIEITLAVDPDLRPVLADATQLQQVVLNLSINARDAMPGGGVLAIRAENSAGSIVISVADNGAGMTPEVRGRIFEPFFTTKSGKGGTGLGLAMVASIIERHKGKVEIDTAPGEGTTVRLILPVA
jgi:signal transduction histidine kinase